jgi:hypothetical protein
MQQRFMPLAVVLVLLASASSDGRVQPTQQAGSWVHPEQEVATSRTTGPAADTGSRGISSSSRSVDSKQAAAVSLAGEVLQQLSSHVGLLQEQLQQLQQVHHEGSPEAASPAPASRALLVDSSDSAITESTSTLEKSSNGASTTTNTATSTDNSSNSSSSSNDNGNVCVMWAPAASAGAAAAGTSTSTTATGTTNQKTNARKVGSRVNLVVSDAWLIVWSGLQILQACVQILGTLLAAAVDGTVTVDSQLVLRLVDLGSAFSSGVSYLLYSIFLLNADAVAPWL